MSQREGIMLAIPLDEKKLSKWPAIIVQPKIDGLRCRAIVNRGGQVVLLSSQCNMIDSVPHINEALASLNLAEGTELDGELYCHELGFEKICSIVKRGGVHRDSTLIEYHVFDIISEHEQDRRLNLVHDYVNSSQRPRHPCLMEVNSTILQNAKIDQQIAAELSSCISRGYEGIILRNPVAPYEKKRSNNLMKFKPTKQDNYIIIGTEEEISIKGEAKDTLGAFICQGSEGHKFNVGTGPMLTKIERQQLWRRRSELVGKVLRVKYQQLTAGSVPRFPVALELIVVT